MKRKTIVDVAATPLFVQRYLPIRGLRYNVNPIDFSFSVVVVIIIFYLKKRSRYVRRNKIYNISRLLIERCSGERYDRVLFCTSALIRFNYDFGTKM